MGFLSEMIGETKAREVKARQAQALRPKIIVDIYTKPGTKQIWGTTSTREEIFIATAASPELAQALVTAFRITS